jgi:hypothetical protein
MTFLICPERLYTPHQHARPCLALALMQTHTHSHISGSCAMAAVPWQWDNTVDNTKTCLLKAPEFPSMYALSAALALVQAPGQVLAQVLVEGTGALVWGSLRDPSCCRSSRRSFSFVANERGGRHRRCTAFWGLQHSACSTARGLHVWGTCISAGPVQKFHE